jgi:hypothetical protein
MYNLAIFILLVFYSSYNYGQEKITINFHKFTYGDYDLILKDILEQNGYVVKINYKIDSPVRKGLYLDYFIANRKYSGVFDTISFKLYNRNELIGYYEKKLSIFNMGSFSQVIDGLNETFQEVFSSEHSVAKKKSGYWNIPYYMLKLDRDKYYILVKAPAMYSIDVVEKVFLNLSKQIFGGFHYYSKSLKYNYSAPGPITTYHSAYMVGGIINENNDNEIIRWEFEPKELDEFIRMSNR